MSVNINTSANNNITITNSDRVITVNNNNQSTSINVTQPITDIISVATVGPQGPIGPQGPQSTINTSSLATTGSNNFIGNQTITGSLNVTGSITGSLLGTASFATTASYIISPGSDTQIIYNDSSSLSGTPLLVYDKSLGRVNIGTQMPVTDNGIRLHVGHNRNGSSGILVTNINTGADAGAQLLMCNNAGFAAQWYAGSSNSVYGNNTLFLRQIANGEFRFVTDVANQTFYFGNDLFGGNPYARIGTSSLFSGNVSIGKTTSNARLDISGSTIITGSLNVTAGITGSLFGTASFANNIASGLNITASNLLVTNTINTNEIIANSASFGYVETITGSAVIIGQEYIVLNTQTPAARYAGLQIYDSGSNATASIVWDSQTNHFVYENASGSSYSGGGFMAGPRNTGSLADVTYPTLNRVLRSQGDDHLYDSNIIDDDTKVSIGINTEVTGSLIVTNGITGSLFGTSSWAQNALTASFVNTASTNAFIQGGNSFGTQALLGTNDNQNLALETSGSVRIFVSSSGNVGIGTTSPTARLHVAGDLLVQNNISQSTGGYLHLITAQTNDNIGVRYFFEDGTTGPYLQYANNLGTIIGKSSSTLLSATTTVIGHSSGSSNVRLQVRGKGATSSTTALRVENSNAAASLVVLDNGFIGINTGSAQYNLDVTGTTNLQASNTRIRVEGDNAGGITMRAGLFQSITMVGTEGNVGGGSGTLLLTGSSTTTDNGFKDVLAINQAISTPGTNFNALTLAAWRPTISQSRGTIRGIYYNPTITHFSGGTHMFIESTAGNVLFQSGSTPLFFVSQSGNIGVGKIIPNARLDVSGNVIITGSLNITDGINGDTLTIFQPSDGLFRFNSSTIGSFMEAGSSNVVNFMGQQVRSIQRGAYFDGTLGIPLQVGTSGLIVTAGSYNVGIGKTTPNARLDISGSTIISGSLTVTDGITGSLFGTSSFATSASFASTASSVTTLNQNVTITGSLSVSSGSISINGSNIYESMIAFSIALG